MLILISSFSSILITQSYSLPLNGVLLVPQVMDNVPKIDGLWTTPLEWADASETQLKNELNQTAYLRLKHNSTFVFVLIDFVTDHTQSSYDLACVAFDSLDDGGDIPQRDDYLIGMVGVASGFDSYQGTGINGTPQASWMRKGFVGFYAEKGFSGQNNPYDVSSHRIYEFQVNCEVLGEAMQYGFYVFVCDYHSQTLLEWPEGAGGKQLSWNNQDVRNVPPPPTNWGSIENHFIPEFSTPIGIFAATTCVGTIIFSKRKYHI
jgi:hypothetical protein